MSGTIRDALESLKLPPEYSADSIPERLHDLRRLRGKIEGLKEGKLLSVSDTADLFRVSKSTMEKWITGKVTPKLESRNRIAEIENKTLETIARMELEEDNYPTWGPYKVNKRLYGKIELERAKILFEHLDTEDIELIYLLKAVDMLHGLREKAEEKKQQILDTLNQGQNSPNEMLIKYKEYFTNKP